MMIDQADLHGFPVNILYFQVPKPFYRHGSKMQQGTEVHQHQAGDQQH